MSTIGANIAKTNIKKNLPLVLLLALLFVLAVAAELLRKYLLGGIDEFGFAQDPSWYFGSLELRTQALFWKTMIHDLDHSGIYPFSIIYFVIVLVSYFLRKDRNLLAVTSSAVLTFLIGWLVFSNLYLQHDYYKLPVTVVLFISLSVSISYIINYFYMKNSTPIIKVIIASLIIVSTLYIVFTQDYISRREQSKTITMAKEALKPYNIFLDITGRNGDNTSLGGQLGTKYKMMSSNDFNNNCLSYVYQYGAIIAPKNNQCLQTHKYLFNNIIVLDGSRVLYTLDPLEPILLQIPKKEPYLKSDWDIYLTKNGIALYKSPCVQEDTERIFLFRVLPKNGNKSSNSNNFINLDFKFDGIYRNDTCLVYKNLANDKIDAIAIGQYSLQASTQQAIKHWMEIMNIK